MSFGILVPGKPVVTNFRQVNRGRYLCSVDNTVRIKELMIFLLPKSQKLPSNTGVTIYLSDQNMVFEYCGFINNNKPSDLFHVPDSFQKNMTFGNGNTLFGKSSQQQKREVLNIGLHLQTRGEIENLEQGNSSKKNEYSSQVGELANYLTESVANYCSSFSQYVPNFGKEMIVMPLDSMNNWMKRLKRKFKNDPYFWKKRTGKVI